MKGVGCEIKDSAFTAAVYDFFLRPFESLLIQKWRRQLWEGVKGPRVLEAGVGTGLNIAHYSSDYHVTAVDLNESFLQRAYRKAKGKPVQVEFVLADVKSLPFPDHSFDTAVSTFLFCQLPDPMPGLTEIKRVLKPNGVLLMLEHVRPQGRLGGVISSLSGPLYLLTGEQIAHNTEGFTTTAGFTNVTSETLFGNMVKLIRAENDNYK